MDKEYYVVYTSKDTGYYEPTYWIVCATENEEVAKDLCAKFNYRYTKEVVGASRATAPWVKSKEEHERQIRAVVKDMLSNCR